MLFLISPTDSCQYHPGEPYFHDVYKGWTCCKKKSVDFTDFLNFKGCTSGKHSDEVIITTEINIIDPHSLPILSFQKPPEPERKKDTLEDVVDVRAPITPSSLTRPPFDSALIKVEPVVNANFRKTIDELVLPKAEAETKQEDADAIAVGTNCKNNGCTISYVSKESNYTECVHHPGVPVFHEGLKYWSCCQRKTSDFSVFVAQKGCDVGMHKWKSAETCEQTVQCRYDWHQTGNNVVVAIYAKMYDYRISCVQVNPIRLKVHLVFPQQNNATFDMDLELRGVVDVSKTTVQMMGTKVEITLCKAELGSWPKLDFPPVNPYKLMAEVEDDMKDVEIAPSESDSDFDLDDVEPVYSSAKITEISE